MGAPLIPSTPPLPERRRFPRVAMGDHPDVVGLRLVPGRRASLRNLSHGGACIEVASRLLPGTPVDLHATLPGWRWRGRASVVRCHVSALVLDDGVRYEAALQFDLPQEPGGPEGLLTAVMDAIGRGYHVPGDVAQSVPARAVATHDSVDGSRRVAKNTGVSETQSPRTRWHPG
jgi:hypothetical protein